jgi:hypothetical protein
MRAACPKVSGRTSRKALARFVRQSAHIAVVDVLRQAQFLVAQLTLDLFVLALEVPRVFRLHIDLSFTWASRRSSSCHGAPALRRNMLQIIVDQFRAAQ